MLNFNDVEIWKSFTGTGTDCGFNIPVLDLFKHMNSYLEVVDSIEDVAGQLIGAQVPRLLGQRVQHSKLGHALQKPILFLSRPRHQC
jgi:hypothetical protein